MIVQMRNLVQRLVDADDPALHAIASALELGIVALEQAVAFIVSNYGDRVATVSVGAVPFLELFGTVAGGWQLGQSALVALQRLNGGSTEQAFYSAKLVTASFYAEHILARAGGLAQTVIHGGDVALAMDDEQF
ncbi:hypothetical protein D3C81_1800280 [compost metagenome]